MSKRLAISIIAVVLFSLELHAQIRRFYIANDDHTDYVWSASESVYKTVMLTTLDKYLIQIDSTIAAGLPFNHQSKYNCDGSYWFWVYEKNRTAGQMKNLISKVKSGHMTVPFNPLAVLYGGMPAEASIRGMYYAGYLQKKYGIDLKLGISMESQTLPLGLSSLWSGSGVKYSWKGVCGCASRMRKADLQNRDNEVYYYKGLDGQKVLMKWYSLATVVSPCGRDANQDFGGYAEARCLTDYLINRMQLKSVTSKKHIIGAFGYGWDDLQTYTNGFVSLAKSFSNQDQEVIVSNQTDYFREMEDSYGKTLPEEIVAGGNEWDLYIASMAEVSAKVKRSVEKLRGAEAMSTIVSLSDTRFANGLKEMRDSAWMSIGLYPEHDWTADGPVSRNDRAAFQRRLEENFTAYADTLYNKSSAALGNQIKISTVNQRFFVFNPLNWVRNDIADLPYKGSEAIAVHDVSTKKEVLWQFVEKEGATFLRILATDIPPVGYKVFEIVKKAAAKRTGSASLNGNLFENRRYKISVTRAGVVTSLIDKLNGNRQLVAPSPGGRYMNDMGSGLSESGDPLRIENEGPVSVTLKTRTSDSLKHSTQITLYNELLPRIDIHNKIEQNFSALITNTFSTSFIRPDSWHEEIGAVIKAKLKKDGGHYAERNARYDWLTLNHFANIGSGDYNITIANRDCYFFNLGKSTPDSLDADASYINVLVGGQTDGANLGIKEQGKDSSFVQQFSISVQNHAFDKVGSMKSSLEFQQPLVAGLVKGSATVSLPENNYSLLKSSDPDLLIWAIKPAEEGVENNGIIVRVWNLKQSFTNANLLFAKKLLSATETTHVEVDMNPIPVKGRAVSIGVGSQQMKTFRLKFAQIASER
ncbi:MAG: glycoside hydrolase [Chitinophagaceae bacterium]|nr:glycoside hydrolase [Chitinophagaceae bacterium]